MAWSALKISTAILFDLLVYQNIGILMAETTTLDDPTKEITFSLGTSGTAFTIGLVAGAIAGVVAVLCVLNYAKK